MKRIPLTQGKFTLVDDEDFGWLRQWNWRTSKNISGICYARGNHKKDGRWYSMSMHRLIMDAPKEIFIDHKNGNGLDNRKINLRFATNAQNQMNKKKTFGTSRYKGVSWCKRKGKWQASIMWKKAYHLGYFQSEIAAAKAYNKKAEEFFVEFASLNKV